MVANKELVKTNYNGIEMSFSEDGWFNVTQAAERFGKRVDVWLKTDETHSYISALELHLNTTKRWNLIKTKRGKNGGTWFHPKLAVVFARWLDVRFAIWCDFQADCPDRWPPASHAKRIEPTDTLLVATAIPTFISATLVNIMSATHQSRTPPKKLNLAPFSPHQQASATDRTRSS